MEFLCGIQLKKRFLYTNSSWKTALIEPNFTKISSIVPEILNTAYDSTWIAISPKSDAYYILNAEYD